jgi:2-succinyl-5-enolpyruvyl-6-hydroxy-3-cyclohexene-1-carboxylate synthase
MSNHKQSVQDLVLIAFQKGIRHIVFSSGSRNAPLIIAFNEHKGFSTYSIHDERSAGFFALGIAQQLGETVALVCTSGSATLNYSPAIAEAYYQRIPLLVITADRPLEWIDQGEGQTMKQHKIYANFIKESYEIFQETTHHDELWYNTRMFNEAINLCKIAPYGPVHVNLPLREPLYQKNYNFHENHVKIIENISPSLSISDQDSENLANIWNRSKRKMILTGVMPYDPELKGLLKKLSEDPSVVILTETTSNIFDESFINNIDRFIMSLTKEEENQYKPDILLTIGSHVVSKKIKTLLRKWNPTEHWDVDESDKITDTYKSLTKHIKSEVKSFIIKLTDKRKISESDFADIYRQKETFVKNRHDKFLNHVEWSDLKAYGTVCATLPEKINVHMANSTAVRYVQLMHSRQDIIYNSNRGVAGIDGCTSTAAGAALINDKLTVLFTGDVAFFYDSNALWNKYLPERFRIIVFNNEGGNIFRYIPGPSDTEQLEDFFESHHTYKAKFIAKAFNINYYSAHNENELKENLSDFLSMQENNRPALLEIFTPRLKNMEILRSYFQNLEKE